MGINWTDWPEEKDGEKIDGDDTRLNSRGICPDGVGE